MPNEDMNHMNGLGKIKNSNLKKRSEDMNHINGLGIKIN